MMAGKRKATNHPADRLRSEARRKAATGQVHSARALRHKADRARQEEGLAGVHRETKRVQRRLSKRDPGGPIKID
jgi:hypothetical protein